MSENIYPQIWVMQCLHCHDSLRMGNDDIVHVSTGSWVCNWEEVINLPHDIRFMDAQHAEPTKIDGFKLDALHEVADRLKIRGDYDSAEVYKFLTLILEAYKGYIRNGGIS